MSVSLPKFAPQSQDTSVELTTLHSAHPFNVNERIQKYSQLKPRLKSGVTYLKVPSAARTKSREEIYVGTGYRGITFASEEIELIKAVFEHLDGKNSLATIAGKLGHSLGDICAIAEELDSAGLVDTERTQIKINERAVAHDQKSNFARDDSDGALRSLIERIQPELELTTWYEGCRDGGVKIIHARKDFPILIMGTQRIGVTLAALLHASGFQSIRTYPSPVHEKSHTITFQDICGGYIRHSDYGLAKSALTSEMNNSISLFPYPRNYHSHGPKPAAPSFSPRLIISIGWPTPDLLQTWMSETIPFLIVDEFTDRTFTIGPLVEPGQSACPECIRLTLCEREPLFSFISDIRKFMPNREVPSSLAAFIAGAVSLDAMSYADCGLSDYRNSQVKYSLNELGNPQRYNWGLHPECMCHRN